MKIGDLVYDDHYGHGVVIGEEEGDYMIHFYELGATGWVEVENKELMETIEVISAGR